MVASSTQPTPSNDAPAISTSRYRGLRDRNCPEATAITMAGSIGISNSPLDEADRCCTSCWNTGTKLVVAIITAPAPQNGEALRFGQANPTVMSQRHLGETHVSLLKRMVGFLAGDGASAERTIRGALVFGTLVISVIGGEFELPGPLEERK